MKQEDIHTSYIAEMPKSHPVEWVWNLDSLRIETASNTALSLWNVASIAELAAVEFSPEDPMVLALAKAEDNTNITFDIAQKTNNLKIQAKVGHIVLKNGRKGLCITVSKADSTPSKPQNIDYKHRQDIVAAFTQMPALAMLLKADGQIIWGNKAVMLLFSQERPYDQSAVFFDDLFKKSRFGKILRQKALTEGKACYTSRLKTTQGLQCYDIMTHRYQSEPNISALLVIMQANHGEQEQPCFQNNTADFFITSAKSEADNNLNYQNIWRDTAHSIRTELATICGFSELIKEDQYIQKSPLSSAYLNDIIDSIRKIDSILEDSANKSNIIKSNTSKKNIIETDEVDLINHINTINDTIYITKSTNSPPNIILHPHEGPVSVPVKDRFALRELIELILSFAPAPKTGHLDFHLQQEDALAERRGFLLVQGLMLEPESTCYAMTLRLMALLAEKIGADFSYTPTQGLQLLFHASFLD